MNPFVVNYNDTVQIVVNNNDVSNHPFHLHGHDFQVLTRPDSGTGSWSGRDENYENNPPMRDTVTIMPHSYVVLRFRATNPGVWLFHCHIEWHVEMGLTATVIEAPDHLVGMTFPDDHIDACKKMGIPYQGNAAGNTENTTDTTGFVTVPPTTYDGWVFLALSVVFVFTSQFAIFLCHDDPLRCPNLRDTYLLGLTYHSSTVLPTTQPTQQLQAPSQSSSSGVAQFLAGSWTRRSRPFETPTPWQTGKRNSQIHHHAKPWSRLLNLIDTRPFFLSLASAITV